MTREFLCGPGEPTEADLAVVSDFRAFLAGESEACPVCLAPVERCGEIRCCPDCPGWHLSKGKGNLRPVRSTRGDDEAG